jgi:hypothetical protein
VSTHSKKLFHNTIRDFLLLFDPSDFVLDFVSSMPWLLMHKELAFLELVRSFTAPRVLRRMLDSCRVLDSVQRFACWGMLQLFCSLMLYLHWVACLWYVVAKDGWFKTHAIPELGLEDVDPYFISFEVSNKSD